MFLKAKIFTFQMHLSMHWCGHFRALRLLRYPRKMIFEKVKVLQCIWLFLKWYVWNYELIFHCILIAFIIVKKSTSKLRRCDKFSRIIFIVYQNHLMKEETISQNQIFKFTPKLVLSQISFSWAISIFWMLWKAYIQCI